MRLKEFTNSSFWIAGGIGTLLGLSLTLLSMQMVIAALAGIFLVIVLPKKPETVLLIILLGTSTLINEEQIPRLPVGIGQLYIIDALLLALIGIAAIRILVDTLYTDVRTSLDLPMLLFYGLAVFSTFIAIRYSSLEARDGFTGVRYITYYLTFFVVTHLVKDKSQVIFLFNGMLFLAMLVAIFTIIQYFLGTSITILSGRVEVLSTQGKVYSGITRVITPGTSLLLVGFICNIAIIVIEKFRRESLIYLFQTGVIGIGILLSFHRNLWAGAGLSIFLLIFLMKKFNRRWILGWALAATFLGSVLLFTILILPESKGSLLMKSVYDRFSSIFRLETYSLSNRESTLRWRDFEYEHATAKIKSNPIFGIGLGSQYRPYLPGVDWEGFDGRAWIHNGHMWILVKTGILGYLSFIGLSIVFLIRGFKYWRLINDTRLRAIVIGSTLSYFAILLGSIAEPLIMIWPWITVIGILMGINEVILRLEIKKVNIT
jgi:hypothetical protein